MLVSCSSGTTAGTTRQTTTTAATTPAHAVTESAHRLPGRAAGVGGRNAIDNPLLPPPALPASVGNTWCFTNAASLFFEPRRELWMNGDGGFSCVFSRRYRDRSLV